MTTSTHLDTDRLDVGLQTGFATGDSAKGFGVLDRNTLAPSNAALVERAAELCAKYDRPVATPAQAREILGLRSA